MCNFPMEDAEEYCPRCGYAQLASSDQGTHVSTAEKPIFVASSTQQVLIRAIPAAILGGIIALYLFDVVPDAPIYSLSPNLSLNLNLVIAGIVLCHSTRTRCVVPTSPLWY